jgi:hypothetical protein
MSVQYDVKSNEIDSSGSIVNGPARLKGIYVVGGATAGSIDFVDSTTSAGSILVTVDTVVTNAAYILIPGDGVKFTNGIYANFNGGAAATTAFYG